MEQNTGSGLEPKIELKSKTNSIVLIIGAVIVLIGLGIWYWQAQKEKIIAPSVNAPEVSEIGQPASPTIKEDSTSVINQELDSIDIGDLNKEFQTIDSDLNSL
ncbi:hypothetical protein A3G50_01820 [Candidatus Jorgensenbacteria bacterium RIFCSPLOWO2_12_FULL_42_11]|uniref:Uncharacterized protein n=1 Tax=Candidatus Jorgensenbacteria bacterium RIFCSPLOWO2_12_FULL_42_11 TaxID=1798473 RepID=A0A1F6C1V8_9BACT|nr:MAG: hypothetical protein A3G50_01820 [Candidatus Jorgensenbacteria bacterium RIFCSPLOWO2_12_FULL_42_11]